MGLSPQDRRAVSTARRLDQDLPGRRNASESTGDPYMTGWLGRQHPEANAPRIETGTLIDVIPGGYCYLVSAGIRSLLWCSPGGTSAGFGSLGGRPLHTYTVGSTVYFIRHPETPYLGTIVGAEPHWSTHTGYQPADGVWPFVRSGQKAEPAHQYPIQASATLAALGTIPLAGVDLVDFSAGRPIDATGVGEWGVMMETGVGVFADPMHAYLRVDEATGVFAFYPDQLLRIAGHNYQRRTVVTDAEELEDEGELATFESRCVYPWEAYGNWRWNQVTLGWESAATDNHGLAPGQGTVFMDPADVQNGTGTAVREPEYFDQLPAARAYRWGGYLGQGDHDVVAAPAQLGRPGATPEGGVYAADSTREADVTWRAQANAPSGRLGVNGAYGPDAQPYATPPNRRIGGPDQPGLHEAHRTLTGGIHERTARRIVLAKRPSIPTPRQVKRPEDPTGDRPASTTGLIGDLPVGTYDPSGLGMGGTPAHHVVADIVPESWAHRAASLDDALAYYYNWENLHPFAYHESDWSVAQEGGAGSLLVNQTAPLYGALENDQYLDPPELVSGHEIDVDHRYGEVDVYENESVFAMLDDGTIVITDGWGSEIRMGGGSIELRCSGDIGLYPGRNLVTWAGHDVILRAHDTVDVTAANGDLRTKAERNHHSLAGNSGCGGFLFETKALCPAADFDGKVGEDVISSGFTVLAPHSQFLVLAQDVALVLTDPDEGESQGRMVFDAGIDREIHTRSQALVSRISTGSVVHLFDGGRANEFSSNYNLLGPDVMSPRSGYFAQCVFAGKWLYAGAHVATAQGGPADVRANTYGATSSSIVERESYLETVYLTAFDSQAAYPIPTADAEFSMRNALQYRSTDYEFWRSRWESIAVGDDQTLETWSEPAVVGLRSATVTQPHPGERWLDNDGYRYHTYTFVDPAAGWTAVDRDLNRTTYETAEYAATEMDSLELAYPVSVVAGHP